MDEALAHERHDCAGRDYTGPDGDHRVRKTAAEQRRDQRAGPCARSGQGNGDKEIKAQQF